MRPHPDQSDLFRAPVFAPRERIDRFDAGLFQLRMKQAMANALTRFDQPREDVAAAMAKLLGQPSLSRGMLDAYTAPSKPEHDIPLTRFKALARVTGDAGLWDQAICDEGLFVLAGDEPRLAEIARLQQAQREIAKEIRMLKSVPVMHRGQGGL